MQSRQVQNHPRVTRCPARLVKTQLVIGTTLVDQQSWLTRQKGEKGEVKLGLGHVEDS